MCQKAQFQYLRLLKNSGEKRKLTGILCNFYIPLACNVQYLITLSFQYKNIMFNNVRIYSQMASRLVFPIYMFIFIKNKQTMLLSYTIHLLKLALFLGHNAVFPSFGALLNLSCLLMAPKSSCDKFPCVCGSGKENCKTTTKR